MLVPCYAQPGLRRRSNMETKLGQCLVFAGRRPIYVLHTEDIADDFIEKIVLQHVQYINSFFFVLGYHDHIHVTVNILSKCIVRKAFTTLPVWSPQHSCPWSYTVSVIVNSIGSILDIGLSIHCMCFVTAHYRVSCDGIGHTRHVAETGYLENSLDPLDPRPTTLDPRL